jgi:hypothetical protein
MEVEMRCDVRAWNPVNQPLRMFIIIPILWMASLAPASQELDIRKIDFYNFAYPWNELDVVPDTWEWLTSSPAMRISTVGGLYSFHGDGEEGFPAPLISVEAVTYGALLADGRDQAAVSLNYSTGGTANWDYLYVYTLEHGQPVLLARLRTGSRGAGGLIGVSIRHGLLILDFADKDRMDGDCCSEGYVRVKYRWEKGTFVEIGTRQRGDLDSHEGPERPTFSEYSVTDIYHGQPAPPIITQEFRSFRTRIRYGSNSEVEFAGHYTIPRWGCGTDCNAFVIADSISGKVYDGLGVDGLPVDWREQYAADKTPRMEFHPNSRLLKINACPNEENCGFYDYVMIDGKGLILIRMELLPAQFQSTPTP